MATSHKRTRELNKLRGDAADIWGAQREVLGHAKDFWQTAGSEAATIARNDVAPRVRDALDNQVKPAVSTGVANASIAATHAKDRLVNDVAPKVSSALASSSLSDLADDPTIQNLMKKGKKVGKKAKRKALKKAAKQAAKHPKATLKVAKTVRAYKKSKKSGIGAGGVFLIVLGVIALGAVVFAAVQTLRADDELWVADDDDTATP